MKVELWSPEHIEQRKTHITATDARVIMGVDKWKNAYKLYMEKKEGEKTPDNEGMRRGREREPQAIAHYEEIKGVKVKGKWVTKDGWMGATLDGISEDGKTMVEVKNSCLEDHQTALNGNIPLHYYPQLQWQMEVTGLDEMDYVSQRLEDFEPIVIVRVKRSPDYCTTMVALAKEFHARLLEDNPPDHFDSWVDHTFMGIEDALAFYMEQANDASKKVKELKDKLIEKCEGKKTLGNKFKITPFEVSGSVNYDGIPELQGVDLEQYRKPHRVQWRFDIKK